MIFSYIYRITNVETGEFYIGKTINLESRMNDHRNNSCNKNLKKSIERYGWDSHKIDIIHLLQNCSPKELDMYERMEILNCDRSKAMNSNYNLDAVYSHYDLDEQRHFCKILHVDRRDARFSSKEDDAHYSHDSVLEDIHKKLFSWRVSDFGRVHTNEGVLAYGEPSTEDLGYVKVIRGKYAPKRRNRRANA